MTTDAHVPDQLRIMITARLKEIEGQPYEGDDTRGQILAAVEACFETYRRDVDPKFVAPDVEIGRSPVDPRVMALVFRAPSNVPRDERADDALAAIDRVRGISARFGLALIGEATSLTEQLLAANRALDVAIEELTLTRTRLGVRGGETIGQAITRAEGAGRFVAEDAEQPDLPTFDPKTHTLLAHDDVAKVFDAGKAHVFKAYQPLARAVMLWARERGPWDSGNPDHTAEGGPSGDLYNEAVRACRADERLVPKECCRRFGDYGDGHDALCWNDPANRVT